jgi:hypothetical protein
VKEEKTIGPGKDSGSRQSNLTKTEDSWAKLFLADSKQFLIPLALICLFFLLFSFLSSHVSVASSLAI